MSVEPRPAATMFAPCSVAPRANASASGADEVRMSCTVTIGDAFVSRANAAPTASAVPSSISSGTMPRTSYALNIFARSVTSAPASGSLLPAPYGLYPYAARPYRGRMGQARFARAGRLRDRIRQRLQVVVRWRRRLDGQSHDLPAKRRGQALGVCRAQVVAVGFDLGREGPENRGGVSVDIGEGENGGLLAGDTG